MSRPPRTDPGPELVGHERFDVPDAMTGSRRGEDLLDGLEMRTANRPRAAQPPAPVDDVRPALPLRLRIGAAVVLVAAILAVVIASIMSKSKDPGGAPTSTSDLNTLPKNLQPVSGLTATREGTTLRIAWTDTENGTGTHYVVSYTTASGQHEDPTSATSYVIDHPPPPRFCVTVAASRDGAVQVRSTELPGVRMRETDRT